MKCVGWPACNSKFSFSCCLGWNWTCTSLLFRYTLIKMPESAVAISKVTHTRREAFFGLKARRDIQVGSYIKETCSLTSLDQVGEQGPSIIEAMSSQILPSTPRLILGPFHFVNHDYGPNSQVSNNSLYFSSQLMMILIKISAIANIHAFVILAIKNIPRGQEITVRYNRSGYYAEECLCKTCTGKDPKDVSILKPKYQAWFDSL